jgi:cytochrome c oxidase subunit IV
MATDLHATPQLETAEPHGSAYQRIWVPFLILLAVTVVEFIIALAVPNSLMGKPYKNAFYIILTIMKAYYIVSWFMHLRFERVGLIYAIVVPLAFIVLLLAAMFAEAGYMAG